MKRKKSSFVYPGVRYADKKKSFTWIFFGKRLIEYKIRFAVTKKIF